MIEEADKWMARAIEIAQRGFPAPNPHVGCVLVKDGRQIAEGWHEYAGASHAEAAALNAAGGKATGSDAYITLEPCSHFGRTPPCAQRLIQEGVSRVLYACDDPNPRAAGGATVLREAGIEVTGGILADEAAWINRQFLFSVKSGRPYVSLKAAITLDGFIARLDGTSKWITGEKARAVGHQLRAQRGSVLVGRATVEMDNPRLTARASGVANQPLRFVLDPSGRLSGRENALLEPEGRWLVGSDRPGALLVPANGGSFAISDVLQTIAGEGATGVLVEGGGKTIRSFLESGLVEEVHLFVAPILWSEGRPWAGGWEGSLQELGFGVDTMEQLDRDLHVSWMRKSGILGTITA